MSPTNDVIVSHPMYIVRKLVFIHVYLYANLYQTIAVFILVIFFYLEPTMVICMFKSMWNSYVWLFIYFILFFKYLLKIMITNAKLTVINS